MKQNLLRGLLAALLAFACSAWSQAQEEALKPKSSPSLAPQEAKTKAATQDTKAKAAQDTKAKAAQDTKTKAAQDAKTKTWEKKAKARAKAKAEARARATDVNHASKAELKKLPGITDAFADAIVAKRPYKVKADLVVKQAIPMDLYQTIRKQVKVAAN